MSGRFFVVFLTALSGSAFAQSEDELRRYEELDHICEAARAQKLAPIRAELIESCVKDEQRPREACEREFGHYGNTRGKVGGGAIAGQFYDLPECVAAFEARRAYRQ
ncbi:MAG TPA: hypothetical protein VFR86_23455 [Burkholderiaceae bacterium]|nr:hypothetical protein [Burkholderiaceae bacterium]